VQLPVGSESMQALARIGTGATASLRQGLHAIVSCRSFQLRYRIRRAVFANGDRSPKGPVIGLGEVRLETSTENNDA